MEGVATMVSEKIVKLILKGGANFVLSFHSNTAISPLFPPSFCLQLCLPLLINSTTSFHALRSRFLLLQSLVSLFSTILAISKVMLLQILTYKSTRTIQVRYH